MKDVLASPSVGANAVNPQEKVEEKTAPRGVVLLVDDEPTITRGYARTLSASGFVVEVAHDANEAARRCRQRSFDVVVSDISMPGMSGLELLRSIREHDLDLPVILMTGGPAIESAVTALEYGALQYLIKPVETDKLEEVIIRAVRLHEMARVRREALEIARAGGLQLGDRAGLEARFSRALNRVWVAYQPIVSWSQRHVFAHEALVRSEEPSLPGPGDLFDAAERLGTLHDLGRVIRARVAQTIREVPSTGLIFVNVHTADLQDEQLYAPEAPLSEHASRVVLEITERAALDQIKDLMARTARLRAMGYRIAIDDLGAGYAGLTSFAQLEPEVVKVDMSLIRGLDSSPTKQKLIGSIIGLCRDLDITIIAEGIETAREREALIRLGGDLCQGYLFARPGKPYPIPDLVG